MASTTDIQVRYIFTADYSRMNSAMALNSRKIESDASAAGTKSGGLFSKAQAAAISAGSVLIAKATNAVTNSITSNIGAAVKRVDTLNQFPKAMQNMGISAKDAQRSIKTISKDLIGLPTRLDDAASAVQRMTAKTGDVNKSTKYFTALNHAILAGTNDIQKQNSALEQIQQAFAAGKMSMQDWKPIMQAMPGQMKQVAKSMGMSVDELAFSLGVNNPGSPTVSMEQFLEQIAKLDKEGVAGFASFEKQARDNVGGIQTTIENMNAAITRGITAVITTIGEENIKEWAEAFGKALEEAGKKLGEFINWAKDNKDTLVPIAKGLAAAALAVVSVSTAAKGLQKVSGIFKTISGAGKSIGNIFGKIKAPKNMADSILGGVDPKKTIAERMSGLGETIKSFAEPIKGIFEVLKTALVGAAQAIVEPIKVIFKGIGEAIAGFFSALANPAILLGALVFAGVAAAIAAAILLIGGAINLTMPAWEGLFNKIVMPFAYFIRDTVLILIDALTKATIQLTNQAIIPLGNFLLFSFVVSVNTVTNAIIRLTRQAVIPLVNTLSGAFTRVIRSISDLINNTLKTALQGVKGIIDSVGGAFTNMGNAIRNALNGVSGVLREFRGLVDDIGNAMIGLMALATGQSVTYGRGFAKVTKAAMGGRVFGIGTSTSDSNLYALSKGEYVVRASSAKSIGYDMLDYMNTTGRVGGGTNEAITVNQYNTVNTPVDMQIINQRLGNAVRRATA